MNTSTLGRGLNSLIPPAPGAGGDDGERVLQLDVDSISPNTQQPRQQFDHEALEDLINSIKQHGIIQPLVVVKHGDGYQLIAGERRLRAAKTLGKKKVPAVVRSASEQEKLELALVENVQRQNLNPIDKAVGYQRLMDEFSMTQEAVAKKVGQSRAAVANAVRMLTLSEEMQKALAEEKITEGHAKILLGVKDENKRQRLFDDIVKNNMTVRTAASQAKGTTVATHTRTPADPNMTAQQERLQEALGTKVRIDKKGNRGSIKIEFYSLEELKEIIKKIVS